jgi:hypothetical protein
VDTPEDHARLAPPSPERGLLRLGVVVLLLLAAFFTALPWLGCVRNPVTHVIEPFLLRVCTFGTGVQFERSNGLPGFSGPYWGSLIVGVAYLIAAILAARTRRSL